MKPNHLIIIAFVLFIGFILTLVYKTFGVKDDLVAEDYYNQEIQYQQTLDQKTNVQRDSSNVVCTISAENITLNFFDKGNKSEHVKGSVSFLRPSNSAMDKSFSFESTNGSHHVHKNQLQHGLYMMKVQWNQNGKEYIKEEELYIN